MPVLKFALDEDVPHSLASLLRSHGQDADSAKELGRLGLSDARVLLRTAVDQQTLVTHNNKDFRSLHEAWVTWGRHAGILISPHMKERDLARILEEFEESAGWMSDRLFAWSPTRLWHELHV